MIIESQTQHDERNTRPRCCAGFLLLLCCLIFLPGCSLVGAVADKAVGQPPRPAKFEPNKLEPMIVIAENFTNPADRTIDSEQVTRLIYDDLREHKVAPQIDPVCIIDLRSQDSEKFHKMSIPQIGRWAGAKQVLYVNITESSLTAPIGTEMTHGGCSAQVKIIDADSGQTRWPPDMAQGYPVIVQTPVVQDSTSTDEATVRSALEHLVAERVSRLFYKHEEETDEVEGG